MPLLPNGHHICLACLNERNIPNNQWLLDEYDETVFTSPPCPTCGAQETFCYHDEVYGSIKTEKRPLPPEDPDGPERFVEVSWEEPDPDIYDAMHMVIIEEKAKSLGRKQKKVKSDSTRAYPRKPQKPDIKTMRDHAEKRGRHLRIPVSLGVKNKAEAEAEYEKHVDQAKAAQVERVKHLKAEKAAAEKARKPLKEELPDPEPQEDAPIVDKGQPKVSRFQAFERSFEEGETDG